MKTMNWYEKEKIMEIMENQAIADFYYNELLNTYLINAINQKWAELVDLLNLLDYNSNRKKQLNDNQVAYTFDNTNGRQFMIILTIEGVE